MRTYFISVFLSALALMSASAAAKTDYEFLIKNAATSEEFQNVVSDYPKILKADIGDLGENALLCAIRLGKPAEVISFLFQKKMKAADTNKKKQDALIYVCIYSADNPLAAEAVIKQYGSKKSLTKALRRKDSYKKCALDYIREHSNMSAYELIEKIVEPSFIEEYRPQSEPTVTMRMPSKIIADERSDAEPNGTEETSPETELPPDSEGNQDIPSEEAAELQETAFSEDESIPEGESASAVPFKKLFLYDYEPAQQEPAFPQEEKNSFGLAEIENPNKRDANGRTPLMKAVKDGNDWEVRSLIKSGADIHMTDNEGWTAFMYAVRYQNNVELVNILLKNGANPTVPNNYGTTALQLAAMYSNNPDILRLVLEQYPSGSNEIFKSFILALTSNTGSPATQSAKIKVFMEKNIPLNRFYEGKTPLMYAAEYSTSTDILKELIDNGAMISIRDADGRTAFYYASQNSALAHDDIYWSLNGH